MVFCGRNSSRCQYAFSAYQSDHEPYSPGFLPSSLESGGHDIIKSSRGLRHGVPLSPYLLLLCMDRLSQWIHKKVGEGRWKPLKASRE